MLLDVIMWFAGVLITVTVFIISYRKTIRARKERVKSANKEIVAIMARSIANPKINIDKKIIQGIIRSKSREYKVSIDDLNDVFIILEDVMTTYIENEFISEKIKNTLIQKVKILLKEKDTSKIETNIESYISRDRTRILMSTFFATIAMVAVMVASFGLIKPASVNKVDLPIPLLVSMTASIAIATLIAFMKLTIERQKKLRDKVMYKGPMLEEIVLSALEERFNGSNVEREMLFMDGKRIDFVVDCNSEKIPVEVKYLLDSKSLLRAIKELKEFIKRLEANKGLLIVNTSIPDKEKRVLADDNIFVIENAFSKRNILRQLRNI